MTDIQPQDTDGVSTANWIDCPHCAGKVLVEFKTRVYIQSAKTASEAESVPPGELKAKAWRDGLSQQQVSILDHAIRTGLLASFVATLERGPHHGMPKNTEKYFLEWVKMARSRMIPEWALNEFKGLYPGKFIEFYGSNFVGGVIADGEIMLFLPIDLISGLKLKTTMGGIKSMAPPEVSGVRQWLRTKMGYVPAEARIFLAEARKRSIGEYANPVL